MQIDRVDLWQIRMRLKSPFVTSFGIEQDRECILLCVHAEGVEGWGECVAGHFPGYSYETTGTAWHVLTEFFLPIALEETWESVHDLQERLKSFKGHPLARAGLELAFWDLFGKAVGRTLASLLGGVRSRVPVGVSVGIQRDPEALVDAVSGYVGQGYRRVKLKIKPGRDHADVAAVRRAFLDLMLQVDANSAYRLDDSPIFEAMDDLGLVLIEQPLAEDDLLDHSKLQARLKTALCLDESILSVRHAEHAIEMGACRVINIKPGRVGGLSEAVAIHNLCASQAMPVWCGGMLETGIGRAANLALASLPGFTLPGDISASDRYYAEDIAWPAFVLNQDSTIDVPRGPGLGVTVDQRAVEKFALKHEVLRR